MTVSAEDSARKVLRALDRSGVSFVYAEGHPLGRAIEKLRKELARLDAARAASQAPKEAPHAG